MPESLPPIIINLAWLAGVVLTFITFLRGLKEYRKNNQIKRTEFFEKLFAEFNDPKTFIAKKILDDFWIDTNGSMELSDKELIDLGSREAIEKKQYPGLVQHLLRDHKQQSVSNPLEQRARESFDQLLDFFAKLDYYFSVKLISKSELDYFRYYIESSAYKANGAVVNYARRYGYPSLFRLFNALDIPIH